MCGGAHTAYMPAQYITPVAPAADARPPAVSKPDLSSAESTDVDGVDDLETASSKVRLLPCDTHTHTHTHYLVKHWRGPLAVERPVQQQQPQAHSLTCFCAALTQPCGQTGTESANSDTAALLQAKELTSLERPYVSLMVFTAALVSFGHGSNDIANRFLRTHTHTYLLHNHYYGGNPDRGLRRCISDARRP
jgi:hypothetical protein